MMRLRPLGGKHWTVAAEVTDSGECAVEADLVALVADPKTKATGTAFFALFDRIEVTGPIALGAGFFHQLDPANQIYEFVKRGHRLLCFLAEGRVVIVSHVVAKSTQKMPRREITRAKEMRDRYLRESKSGEVVFE